ncbi:hypothetical protein [Mycobacterium sp. 050134]|uniref:hypothetical protein n=1 Tax=Mycobacterium sp. 050134 TaxID=3096111 RepID=UPI002ED92D1A
MEADDPAKRIAELERQLAQQRRIAELEREIAEAGAAAGQGSRGGPRPGVRLTGANRIGAILGILGVCVGSGAAITAMVPSSALWMSPLVCSGPYHLTYNTWSYSYRPGQSGTSVSFQCVGDSDWYNPSWLAIDALQSAMATLIIGGAIVVGRMLWVRLRQ